ncbi:MAG: hypothetical protein ACREL5_03045 [Gemmatimonadales bacterium]
MNRITMRIALGIALVSASSSELGAQARLARPVIDTVSGHIIRVMNPGPTAWTDTNGWKLVYERTVQPAEGSRGELDKPDEAVLLDNGMLIESERDPVSIRLFDAHGNFVRTIGRAGAGPGEYQAVAPALVGDSLLFIQDYMLARGTLMTLDGKVVRIFPTACCFGYPAAADNHSRLHVMGPAADRKGQWITFTPAGDRVDSMRQPAMETRLVWTVRTPNSSATFTIPLSATNIDLVLRNGNVLYGATDAFRFAVTAHGSDTIRLFAGPQTLPAAAPGQLRDSLFHLYTDHNASLRAIASEGDIPKTLPLWRGMVEDGDANLWVLAGGETTKVPARFAVYAHDGRFLGWVAAPPIKYLGRTSWSADHVAILDTDANDLPRIRIFRIDRHAH